MEQNTIKAIDELINSFQKNAYTEKEVKALLQYLVALKLPEDQPGIHAIIKVLGFCTKDFVKELIIKTIQSLEASHPIKPLLLSVCWESGLDYEAYLRVFVDILLETNELAAIEANTIITELMPNKEALKQAIEAINNSEQSAYSPTHRVLINDSLQFILNQYNSLQ